MKQMLTIEQLLMLSTMVSCFPQLKCAGTLFYTALLYKLILPRCRFHFRECEIHMLRLIANKKLGTQLEELILL